MYSEILNTHLEVTMTKRAQRLIDQSYGLDNYLLEVKKSFRFKYLHTIHGKVGQIIYSQLLCLCLQTPVNEVYSLLALKIKRQILLALSGGKVWPLTILVFFCFAKIKTLKTFCRKTFCLVLPLRFSKYWDFAKIGDYSNSYILPKIPIFA